MINSTVVYYTSNTENEQFEKKIRDEIWKNKGDLPLISVSRKPIDFGTNVCVGDIPHCDLSAFKQLLTGLKEVKTQFAHAAESDALYPPEYFSFIPPTNDNVYRYKNVWVFWRWIGTFHKNLFWKKQYTEGAQCCGTKFWIESLEKLLKLLETNKIRAEAFHTFDLFNWTAQNPVITIKTGNSLRNRTSTYNISTDVLPYWGTATDLRNRLWGNDEI